MCARLDIFPNIDVNHLPVYQRSTLNFQHDAPAFILQHHALLDHPPYERRLASRCNHLRICAPADLCVHS